MAKQGCAFKLMDVFTSMDPVADEITVWSKDSVCFPFVNVLYFLLFVLKLGHNVMGLVQERCYAPSESLVEKKNGTEQNWIWALF